MIINTDIEYITRCGYPVRNLHSAGLAYEGEYFVDGHWFLGSWVINGAPEIWTTDLYTISSLTLVELSDYTPEPSTGQEQLRLEGF